jgi:hypothetical protein
LEVKIQKEMKLIRSLTIYLLLAVIMSCGTGITSTTSSDWFTLGPVYKIDKGITPGIAMDSKGVLHLVYMGDDGKIFYRKMSADGKIGPIEEIPQPIGPGMYNSPHLVIDENDVPHVVFQKDYTSQSKVVWYANRIQGSWKMPSTALSMDQGRANYPRLTLHKTAAFVGAFTAGSDSEGKVIKIVDLAKNPKVEKVISTNLWVPTPNSNINGKVFVVGRGGPAGHFIEEFNVDLHSQGIQTLFSQGTKLKTGEPLGTTISRNGIVHAVGISGVPNATGNHDEMWYNSSRRMDGTLPVVTGIHFDTHVSEFVYPVLAEDAKGHIYVSYRDYDTNEGKITIVSDEGFIQPVVFTASVDRLLRWNPHITAAPNGGVYVAWHSEGIVYVRSIGVK